MNDNFKQVIKSLEETKKLADDKEHNNRQNEVLIRSIGALQNAIVESMKVLANQMVTGTINVNDKSNKGTVRTPDAIVASETIKNAIDIVSKNISNLANMEAIVIKKDIDISPIVDSLKQVQDAVNTLPKTPVAFPKEMAVNNLDVLVKAITGLNKQLQSIEFNPNIKVASPIVNVDLSADLKRLEKAIKEIKPTLTMPDMPEFNTERLEAEIIKVADSINRLEFPVPNIKPSYVTSAGAGTSVTLTSTGRVPVELGISPTIDIGDVQVKDASGTVINPSTKENQTSGSQKTQITDSSGTANTMKTIGTAITASDYAIVTNTVIHGETTGGGGGFVDVKVNPSGALTVEATLSTPNTGTVTSASVTNSNTTVLASNNNRMGATIYNEGTVDCLVKLGSTASASSYTVKMIVDSYYEVPFGYTGIITGITASGTATLRVTEMT